MQMARDQQLYKVAVLMQSLTTWLCAVADVNVAMIYCTQGHSVMLVSRECKEAMLLCFALQHVIMILNSLWHWRPCLSHAGAHTPLRPQGTGLVTCNTHIQCMLIKAVGATQTVDASAVAKAAQ